MTTIDGALEQRFTGGSNSVVARDRAGRVFFSQSTHDIPTVFDAQGRYLRVLASRGQGPGELTTVAWIDAGRDDSVRIISFDRLTVFGPDLAYARSVVAAQPLLASITTLGVLSDGNVVLTTNSPLRDSAGRFSDPVYLRNAGGRTLALLQLGRGTDGVRHVGVAAARDSARFWGYETAPDRVRGYLVTLFDQRGLAHRQLVREPSWWLMRPAGERDAAASFVKAVSEDERGRLVVVIAQPKPAWRQIPLAPNGATTPRYDTIVEVIDIRAGVLVGNRRVAGYPKRLLDERYVATYREVNDYPVLDVWRIDH